MSVFENCFRKLVLGLALLLLAGCSSSVFQTSPPPELRQTLVGITNTYLTAIVSGNEKQIVELVYWPEFLTDPNFTKADFLEQFRRIQRTFPPAQHPLVGLRVISVSSRANDATVVLKKDPKHANGQSAPDITVRLMWAGTGWVIKEDSLFGKDKLFDELLRSKKG